MVNILPAKSTYEISEIGEILSIKNREKGLLITDCNTFISCTYTFHMTTLRYELNFDASYNFKNLNIWFSNNSRRLLNKISIQQKQEYHNAIAAYLKSCTIPKTISILVDSSQFSINDHNVISKLLDYDSSIVGTFDANYNIKEIYQQY